MNDGWKEGSSLGLPEGRSLGEKETLGATDATKFYKYILQKLNLDEMIFILNDIIFNSLFQV